MAPKDGFVGGVAAPKVINAESGKPFAVKFRKSGPVTPKYQFTWKYTGYHSDDFEVNDPIEGTGGIPTKGGRRLMGAGVDKIFNFTIGKPGQKGSVALFFQKKFPYRKGDTEGESVTYTVYLK